MSKKRQDSIGIDMPPPFKKETKPSASTRDIVERVVLRDRLLKRYSSGETSRHSQACALVAALHREPGNDRKIAAVQAWLRDPKRSKFPLPVPPDMKPADDN